MLKKAINIGLNVIDFCLRAFVLGFTTWIVITVV